MMKIREATLDDAKGICDVYNYYVENTAVTFETQAVSETEMRQRIADFLREGFSYYVGEIDNKIVGYCYLHKWKNRNAYSLTREITIYLDKDCTGKGLGTLLYQRLFEDIYQSDIHAIIACITVPNEGSVRLHEKFGLKQVSCMKEVGWKFEKWRDVGHWQLIIDRTLPV